MKKTRNIFCLFAAFLLKMTLIESHGIVYVDKDASGGNNGSSWTDAYTSLANALKANTGEFWVAEGVYTPGTDATNTFYLGSNSFVYGGFAGNETAQDQRDWVNRLTVLSGDLGASIYAKNIVTKQQVGYASLNGFTIKDAQGVASYGAGVSNGAGSIAIANCMFTNLWAYRNGGAVYSLGTGLGITNCSFFGCYTTNGSGGAVYATGAGASSFSNCLFVGNWAQSPVINEGGGAVVIYNQYHTNQFRDCTFKDCNTTNDVNGNALGGAIYVQYATSPSMLTGCIFSNCFTRYSGGACYLPANYVGMTNCTFMGCYTTNSGFGGACDMPSVGRKSLSNCVFIGNYVSMPGNGWGGGAVTIRTDGDTNVFRNCVFVGNCTTNETLGNAYGGAIMTEGGWSESILVDCAFTNNRAKYSGGAVSLAARYTSMTNCMFYSNSATNGGYGGAADLMNPGYKSLNYCVFLENYVYKPANGWGGGAITVRTDGDTNAFRNCVFVGNYTTNETLGNANGGAIMTEGGWSESVLVDCAFTNNRAKYSGGAVSLAARYTSMTNCIFNANYTTNAGYSGAADLMNPGYKSLSNCLFVGNYVHKPANGSGGGALSVRINGDTNVFRNCVFVGNCTTNETLGNAYGGAVMIEGANSLSTFTGCCFTNNMTKYFGGAVFAPGPTIMNGCDFAGNMVTNGYGAAIVKQNANTNVFQNCLFVTNWAKIDGGAVYFDNYAVTGLFQNCTFFANVANTGNGGAIRTANASSVLNLNNNIFWCDWCAVSGQEIYNAGTATLVYNDINDAQVSGTGTKNMGAGNMVTNPLFASVTVPYDMHEQSKYGRYQNGTWVKDTDKSACIDAGDPSGVYSLEPIPNGDRINMGRYGNTPEASISFLIGFRNVVSTNYTASAADVVAMLAGSNATCFVLYDTNNWGSTLANWANTNSLGVRVYGETVTNSLTSLLSNVPYYFVFYGTNAALGEEAYSVIGSFSTFGLPNINNGGGATNVLARSATLRCTVLTSHVANATIYYGTTDGGTVIGDWQFSTNVGMVNTGVTYTRDLVNLSTGQVYYYRAYATNSIGDAWAPSTASFMTSSTNFTPWYKKVPITFSGYTKGEPLTNFPMLVTLSNNINNSGFSYDDVYSLYGCDLRFSDDTFENELPYEVEKWDTNGVSYLWVKIPVLSNEMSTIWMYYGRSRQTNYSGYCTNGTVWGNSFRAVWHLNTNELDSSQYKKNGSPFQVTNIAGQIAGGKEFYNNGWVDVPEVALNMDKVTYSVWMKLPSIPDNLDAILDTDTFVANDMQLLFNAGKVRLSVNGNSPADTDSTYTFGASDWNQWRYVTVVYDRIAKTSVFYVNAVPGASNIYTTAVAGSITAANIGSYNISRYFKGVIDEFSIADTVRSSNWIWACYMNIVSNTNFVACGSASNICPITWSLPVETNIATDSATLMAALTGSNEDCIVVYDTNDWGMTLENWQFTNDCGTVASGIVVTNEITNLLSNTCYYYMFYATNAALGTNRFSEVSWFTTISIPVVNNASTTNITGRTASLGYNVITSHTANVTLYYGTTDGGTTSGSWQYSTNAGIIPNTGTYSISISDLIAGVTYYYRCYATNLAGSAWASATTNFNTMSPIFVDTNVVGGANNGSSWANAYQSLATALTNAYANSAVWVAKGTNFTSASVCPAQSYSITTNGVAVYGGFTNGSPWENRNWTNNVTVIDGKGSARRCLQISANDVIVDGIVIKNGGDYPEGIGIRVIADRFTLRHSIVTNCSGSYYPQKGGGIYLGGSGNEVSDCRICNNSPGLDGSRGGGIYAIGTTVIKDSLFSANTSGNAGFGGGVHFQSPTGTLAVTNCFFQNNNAANSGGAIYMASGILYAVDCSFSNNYASTYTGGAVMVASSVTNSAVIKNCAFMRNYAAQIGGAIGHASTSTVPSLSVQNCSFYSNYVSLGSLSGGGIYMFNSPLYVRNSIFWQNEAPASYGKEITSSGNVEYAYSCFTGTNSSYISVLGTLSESNNIVADPMFAYAGDLHLKSSVGRWDPSTTNWVTDSMDSPCIDMGDPSASYTNEPAPNGSRINQGAYGNTIQASKSVVPTVPTVEDSSNTVYYTAAIVRGKMTAGKKGAVTIYYGNNDGGTDPGSWDASYTVAATESQEVSKILIKLDPESPYYYRTYVTNDAGSDWSDGPTPSFNTGNKPPAGPSNVVHVNLAATNAFYNDGSSWPFAMLNVLGGYVNMNDTTNEMWLAKGTYTAGSVMTLSKTNISIYGGFVGSESNRSDRNWTNNVSAINGAGSYRCLNITSNDVVIDGVTIKNGKATSGVGAYVTGNRFSLRHSIVANGTSDSYPQYGGGLYLGGGNNEISDCIISNNCPGLDGSRGGGVYALGTTLIKDSLFTANQSGNIGYGGGVYFQCSTGTLTVTNCFFLNNSANKYGGAICMSSGLLNLIGCNFVSNTVSGSPACGGAIMFDPTADNSYSIKNCSFALNSSAQYGGAIAHGGASPVLSLTVENCSFCSNYIYSGSTPGGAIYMNQPQLFIRNSILWGNKGTALNGNEIYASGLVSYAYSSFTGTNNTYMELPGGCSESNNIIGDPLFTSSVDLHLKSSTGRWDPSVTNWVLDTSGSLCIDLGDPTYSYINEPAPNGGRINMGAYGNTVYASKSVDEEMPTAEDSTNSLNYNTAIIRGKMTTGNKGILTLYYGDTDGHEQAGLWDHSYTVMASENAEVSLIIRDLSPHTLYFYRTYVTNSIGDDWSDPVTLPSSLNFETGDAPPGGAGNVIHVDQTATNAWFNDGSAWPYACLTIVDGLNRMNSATNEIWLAKGTYTYGSMITISKSDISLFGGFAGTETNRSGRNWTNNISAVNGNGAYRPLMVTTNDVTLDGITVKNGYQAGGIGIYVSGQRFALRHCIITNCSGGWYPQYGGGIYLGGGGNEISDSRICNNTAGLDGSCGGGVYALGTTLIKDSLFANNHSGNIGYGGGVYFRSPTGSLFVSNCVFRNNIGGNYGGAIYMASGTLNAANSYFITNRTANVSGGAIMIALGVTNNADIRNCIFDRNASTNKGGAIGNASTSALSMAVENCTFYSNRVDSVTNCGGAIYMHITPLMVRNSILWNDICTATNTGYEIYSVSGNVTVSYSDLTATNSTYLYAPNGSFFIDNILTSDPLFADTSDFHLKSKFGRYLNGAWVMDGGVLSPCIDAGDPASPHGNEPYPNGGRVNMGGYGNTPQASKNGKPSSIIIIR